MNHQKTLAAAKMLLYSMAVVLIPGVSAMALLATPGQGRGTVVLIQAPQHQRQKPTHPNLDTPQQQPATPQQSEKAVVITCTNIRSGSGFVLRDSSGTAYRLNTPQQVEPFDGKSVKVSGKLEADTKTPQSKETFQ